MPGRTWVIAPDAASLRDRWARLTAESDPERKEVLFHPHDGGDRTVKKMVRHGLAGHEHREISVATDKGECITPVRYGFRSFDRQWIIPDNRLLNRANPTLWESYSNKQLFLTALTRHSPTSGPAISFIALIPDLDHYKGSFGGRVFPLWIDHSASVSNVKPGILAKLTNLFGHQVIGEDVMSYIAAIAAHPAYIERFSGDLAQPGLRIPVTADGKLFTDAVEIGREVIWLHTFGERFVAADKGRPAKAPRLPKGEGPHIPEGGTIPSEPDKMPDAISYDAAKRRLFVGAGHIDNVPPNVWAYEVSGKQVLVHWFSYRCRDRSRPIIGDRREPSPLGAIQPDGWLAEYTTELINVLHVLGWLVALEPAQADILNRVCAGPTVTLEELRAANALDVPADFLAGTPVKSRSNQQLSLLG